MHTRPEGAIRSLLRWLTTPYYSRWDAVCQLVFLTVLFRSGSYALAFGLLFGGAVVSGIVKGTLQRQDRARHDRG